MGWWKTGDGDGTLGDEPLDAVGGAVSKVVRQYQAAFGRRPTLAEWEALLELVLGAEDAQWRCSDDAIPENVRIT